MTPPGLFHYCIFLCSSLHLHLLPFVFLGLHGGGISGKKRCAIHCSMMLMCSLIYFWEILKWIGSEQKWFWKLRHRLCISLTERKEIVFSSSFHHPSPQSFRPKTNNLWLYFLSSASSSCLFLLWQSKCWIFICVNSSSGQVLDTMIKILMMLWKNTWISSFSWCRWRDNNIIPSTTCSESVCYVGTCPMCPKHPASENHLVEAGQDSL